MWIHGNMLISQILKYGRWRNLTNLLVQFHHCTEEETTAWEVGGGVGLCEDACWLWPAAEAWTRSWLATAVWPEHALVDGSSKALHIQLKIFGPDIFCPLILFPSAFSFFHSQTCTAHFLCTTYCDRCCKLLKDRKITSRNTENRLWRPTSLLLNSYVANLNFFSSDMDVTHTLLNGWED